MPPRDKGIRLMGEFAQLGETEVRFYQQLSSELKGVPETYGAALDPRTGRFVLILEDLATEDCVFPDTVNPLSVDQAASLVELMALVHGRFWGRLPRVAESDHDLGWMLVPSASPPVPVLSALMRWSFKKLSRDTDLPVECGRYIAENYGRVAARLDAGPHTVLHGDPHPGNTYFRAGGAGLLDWQMVRRGHPMRDVAYALVGGLTTEDRRARERELLDTYRRALAGEGGPELSHDDIWPRYRESVAWAFTTVLTTAGVSGLQVVDIVMAGLQRAIAALEDLETVAALQQP